MFTKSLFTALTLFAFSAVSQVTDCARSYTVVLGDVCDAISASHNVSTFQLAHVNPQINALCTNLFVGENLCLGEVGQDCDQTHVVVSGNSCGTIASTYKVALDVLLANNLNVDSGCTNIYAGEVLCVATSNVYV